MTTSSTISDMSIDRSRTKTLAIDYGTVRIGVAVSYGSLAEPLEVVPNDERALFRLAELCQRERVELVVVGISEAEMAEKTRAFIVELAKQISLPIVTADETLTSHAVEEKLRFQPLKKRQGAIDHYAAAEILQNWLDEGV